MTRTLKQACREFVDYLERTPYKNGKLPTESVLVEITRHLEFLKKTLGDDTIVAPELKAEMVDFLSSVDGMTDNKGKAYSASWKNKTIKHVGKAMAWFETRGWFEKPLKSTQQQKALRKTQKKNKKQTIPTGPSSKYAMKIKDDGNDLAVEQKDLIQQAVININALCDKSADSALQIGRYLLKTFFDNDSEKLKSHSRDKFMSLRTLAEHEEITMSLSALHDSLSLAVYEREIGSGDVQTSEHLKPSHKILLYRVHRMNPLLASQYLKKVVKEKLSVRKLRDLLSEDSYIRSRYSSVLLEGKTGRSALPPIESIFKFSMNEIDHLSKMAAAAELKNALRARSILNNMIRKLKKQK